MPLLSLPLIGERSPVNGFVFYRGRSPYNGGRVVGILTGLRRRSRNHKTGDLVQTWILAADRAPLEAAAQGYDAAVCGSCPHRPCHLGSCYVALPWSPTQVWKSYREGIYPFRTPRKIAPFLRGRVVRLGAYGDPAMIPMEIWHRLLVHASGSVGYTHAWHYPWAQGHKPLLMASADSVAQKEQANRLGWRTFRIR